MLTHELFEKFQINCLEYKRGDTECCNDVEKSLKKKTVKKKKKVFCPNLSYLSKFFPPSKLNYWFIYSFQKKWEGFFKIQFLFAAI